jgi:hypothetical protein
MVPLDPMKVQVVSTYHEWGSALHSQNLTRFVRMD